LGENVGSLQKTNLLAAVCAVLLVVSIAMELPPMVWEEVEHLKWFPESFSDFVYSLPFFLSAYLAQFSILSMHQELHQPTLERARWVTRTAVLCAFVIFSSVGAGGYLLAADYTCESILSNLPQDSPVALLTRVGMVALLSLSYPLFVLPNRVAVCELCG
jgi:amino acid permease